MPPRVLPELLAHAELFDGETLTQKTEMFRSRHARRGWPSWNWADAQAYQKLPPPPKALLLHNQSPR
jgi:hypothetical protein